MAGSKMTSAAKMACRKRHIDEIQPATVEEHFRVLLEYEDVIDTEETVLKPEDLPEWFDEELFRTGQNYYQKNMLSMGLAGMIGLLAVLAIPSILKVLIYTKGSSTACTAFKRYLETIIHIHTLYRADVKDGNSDWWKSLNTVRWKHSRSSKSSCKSGNGAITHRDMALTQFGFIGYALLSADKLSLTNEPKERDGLNHFWRVLGYTLGISDRVNICRKNQQETTKLCKLLLDQVFAKKMKENDASFLHMSSVLIDGLWSIDIALDNQAFMYLWYQLSGVPYVEPLSTYSWLNMQYRSFVLYLLGVPYIGYLVRSGFNRYIEFNYWLAQRYPIIAFLRFGKSHSAINLYPKFFKH